MYAYCINNPTNYLDFEGTDAVWIQESDSAGGFGHAGLLVENEDGKWYFFYWGMESETIDFENVLKAVSGTKAKLVWKEIETDNCDLATTTGVKEALQMSGDPDVNRSELVTDTLYFTGDFSKTFEYIEKLSKESQQYNLLANNCVQQSTKALKNSSFDFSFTKAVIPNVAFRRARVLNCLRNFFD